MLISLAIRMMNQKNNLIVLGTLCLSQPTDDSRRLEQDLQIRVFDHRKV